VWECGSELAFLHLPEQVHAYVHSKAGRTAYLSELRSGAEAVVVEPGGRQRTAVVGRVKVESRPLVSARSITLTSHSHAPSTALVTPCCSILCFFWPPS
jgi:hypothetical protein